MLRCDIPLRLSHELIPDQELLDCRGPQKRRVEVHVKPCILNLLVSTREGRLVNPRAVGEATLEEIVVPPRHLLDRISKLQPLLGRQIDQGPDMSLCNDEGLKGPDRPPRTDDEEGLVLPDDTLPLAQLQLDVVAQQMPPTMLFPVLCHLRKLLPRLFGHRRRGPDLAVRMRVGAAHGGALVLEDLHIPVLVVRDGCLVAREGELEGLDGGVERVRGGKVVGVDPCPVLDDGEDIDAGHVSESEVVLGREGENVADAFHALCLEEKGFKLLIFGQSRSICEGGFEKRTVSRSLTIIIRLLLLDGTVIVDKGKSLFVLWVLVACSARVAGTEVALVAVRGIFKKQEVAFIPGDHAQGACWLWLPLAGL